MKKQILPLFVLLILLLSACQEKKSEHTLQYVVWKKSGNQANFTLHFRTPSGATASTGEIDTSVWESNIYTEVEEGTPYEIEVKAEGKPSIDLFVRKDGSIIRSHEIRSGLDELSISGNL